MHHFSVYTRGRLHLILIQLFSEASERPFVMAACLFNYSLTLHHVRLDAYVRMVVGHQVQGAS